MDKSGAVSGSKSSAAVPPFAFIGLPNADDSASDLAGRPDEHDHLHVEESDLNVPNLAVIPPVVDDGNGSACENFACSSHVNSANLQGFAAFLLVVFDPHELMLLQKTIPTLGDSNLAKCDDSANIPLKTHVGESKPTMSSGSAKIPLAKLFRSN